MAETLPYMLSTGTVGRILDKIKNAKTPERFSQDYLSTVLGHPGGGAKPFIPLAKRLNLLNSDGTPTSLYRRFRGSDEESKAAMATAIKIGYAPLYKRNEYADKLDRKKLEGLIKEITGAEAGSSTLRGMVGTFETLKTYADFGLESTPDSDSATEDEIDGSTTSAGSSDEAQGYTPLQSNPGGVDLSFGYTININLPNTNEIAVFNAIFKSLKEHLL